MISIDSIAILAKNAEKKNKVFFKNIKPKQSRQIDELFHKINDEVFSEINCLECANCCKTLGPLLSEKDISRISKKLNIKPYEFESKYLIIDEDGDYIFKTMPCPFLDKENYCTIYEFKPKACSDYPHTRQPEILKKQNITIKNSYTCPAVFEIIKRVKQSLK